MFFSNETRVSDTSSPTSFVVSVKEPNVTQYGWTKSDANAYNQLIQYVNEAKEIEEKVRIVYAYVLDTRKYVEDSIARLDQFHLDYDQFKLDYKDFLTKWADAIELISYVGLAYNDVLEKFGEIVNMYDYVMISTARVDEKAAFADQRAIDADNSATDANESYIKCLDLYTDLKEGQVYRGIWNPNDGVYPDHAGTNSVWDVVLNDGQTEVIFDGKTFRSGDRLLYIKASTEYQLLATGSGVTSVNGMNGAITITPATINAVSRAGDMMTGGLTAPTLNATGVASAQGLTFNGKTAIGGTNDTWLRLNPHNQFTSGVYVNGLARISDGVEIGAIGSTAAHTLKADGTWSHSGSGSIEGDITSNLNVLGNITENGSRVFSANYVQPEIPFPDVWIPFNDGLQMLAGYGDEVKVDNWVVAKMATFSRASQATYIDKSGVLRTAAINEPRFEKEGLLIEGQSTNLITQSEGWSGGSGSTGANAWVHTEPDSQGWRTVTGGTDDGRPEGAYKDFASNTVLWGTTSTFSLDIKKISGFKVVIRSYNASNADGLGSPTCSIVDGQPLPTGSSFKVTDMGDWLRVTMTRTFGDSGTSIFRMYPFGSNAGDSGSLTYRRVQVEPLPFASSYIPTSGAAATRAADDCRLAVSGNFLPLNESETTTISLDWDIIGLRTGVQGILRSASGLGGAGNIVFRREATGGVTYYRGAGARTILTSAELELNKKYSFVIRVDTGNKLATMLNGSYKGTTDAVVNPANSGQLAGFWFGMDGASDRIFGHIRNFRIWHKALSDTQLKAITS